jgi:G:T/U-mismatch repair DNA glycosylase
VLLKSRIGLTDLNRRVVVRVEDDSGAQPTPDDVGHFVKKVEKFRPKVAAFVMNPETFEKCLKPRYPAATRERGKQEFRIGESEVWLLGSMSVRPKDADAVEQLFDDLAERLSSIAAGGT